MTQTSTALERWPTWASRWFGIALRLALFLAGLVSGALLIFLAYFGASFKEDVPQWDFEAVIFLLLGMLIIPVFFWAAIRPSRVSLASALIAVVVVLTTGAAI